MKDNQLEEPNKKEEKNAIKNDEGVENMNKEDIQNKSEIIESKNNSEVKEEKNEKEQKIIEGKENEESKKNVESNTEISKIEENTKEKKEDKESFNFLKLLHSKNSLKTIFSYLRDNKKFDIIKYNKVFQNEYQITLEDYKKISGKYKINGINGEGKEYLIGSNILTFEGEYKNGK